MTHHKIITNETILDYFLAWLPGILPNEAWYACLFGRHKYDPEFPNTRDSGQLARIVARDKVELKEKIRRLEAPLGSYSRNGAVASQECLSVYIALNPRSLVKANKAVLLEMARRMMEGLHDLNPVSVATTEIHRAVDRKFFIDFDFDEAEPTAYIERIGKILPDSGMYRIIQTRGGFHLVVIIEAIRELKTRWHQELTQLPGCDVRGTGSLTPVPGCVQGGFTPHFWTR